MFVTGSAVSRFGTDSRPLGEMMFWALREAIRDARLDLDDVDAIYIGNNLSALTQRQYHLSAILAGYLPGRYLPIVSVEAACASGGVAMHQGTLALKHYERVAVIGVEKMSGHPSSDLLSFVAQDADWERDQVQGMLFPTVGALLTSEYLRTYGASMDDLTEVALKNHHNGNLNPDAQFYTKQVTREMINDSKVLCSPLRLYDSSPTTDGVAAVILERTKRNPRAVQVKASALATHHLHFAGDNSLLDRKELQHCARLAYQQADIRPDDIQFAEIHDGFTVVELIAMENLGLCPFGEGFKWTREQRTTLKGELPINPSGGLKACGHPLGATGVRQIVELVTQLRGEAGARQVERNTLGLALNIGSFVGSCTIHILAK